MEYPWEIIKKAHAAGLLNSQIPEKFGGPGLDLVADVVLGETVGYGCTGIGTAMMGNDLGSAPLVIAASEEVQKKFLPRLIEEPIMCAYAVTEPGAGSDVAGIKVYLNILNRDSKLTFVDESREEG